MTVLAAPVEYPADVPESAAPMPKKAAFAGTWMFNLIAVGIVSTITGFVVFSPFSSGDAAPGAAGTPGGNGPPSAVTIAPPRTDAYNTADRASFAANLLVRDSATTSSPSTSSTPPTTTSTGQDNVGGTLPIQVVYVTSPTTKPPATTKPPTTTKPPATTTTVAPTTTTATTVAPTTTTTTKPPAATTTAVVTPTTVPLPQCKGFASQPEAQALFDSDPATYAYFDGDGDGVACEDLPGRPVPTTTLPPGQVTALSDVIQPSTRYFGVHTREAPSWMADFDEFATEAGKTPNLDMFFASLGDPFPADDVDALWARSILPMVTFEPIVYCTSDPVPLPDYDCTQGQPELSDIIGGQFDDYFTQWATAAAANGKPIVMRFAHEMNGNWYPWGGTSSGNEPGEYVTAWKHVHDLFDQAGASNVVWFWSVNRVDSLKDKGLAKYYPGDDYVDWVGLSGYYRFDDVAPTFDTTFAATLTELKKVAPNKPLILGETAAGTSNSKRLQWTQAFFAGMLEHPEIWGFVWFNDRTSGNDWRIQYSAEMTAAFAAGIADPRYGSGVAATP